MNNTASATTQAPQRTEKSFRPLCAALFSVAETMEFLTREPLGL